MISAPMAPSAPPSVGVAMPRKIVPSTRKISTSGGISTKVTRSVSFDSSFNPNSRLASARISAVNDATVIDRISTSSGGAGSSRPIIGLMIPSCTRLQAKPTAAEIASSTISERWPLAPLSSR